MKSYYYEATYVDYNTIIRNKTDLIIFLLQLIKEVQTTKYASKCDKLVESSNYFFICIDKMSRVICCSSEKFFSFQMPFKIKEDGCWLKLFYQDYSIDNKTTSFLLSFFQQINNYSSITLEKIYYLLDELIDSYEFKDFSTDLYSLVWFLLNFESGYLRFDHDEKNKNKDIHPLNHLDVNYENYATYKIGLNECISSEQFTKLLDIKQDCYYLNV